MYVYVYVYVCISEAKWSGAFTNDYMHRGFSGLAASQL